MRHAIHRIEHFDIAGSYTLALRFRDGTSQRIDFRPVLVGEVFGQLQDLALFNAVELIRRSVRSSGRTALTSIPKPFTIGRSTGTTLSPWRKDGVGTRTPFLEGLANVALHPRVQRYRRAAAGERDR